MENKIILKNHYRNQVMDFQKDYLMKGLQDFQELLQNLKNIGELDVIQILVMTLNYMKLTETIIKMMQKDQEYKQNLKMLGFIFILMIQLVKVLNIMIVYIIVCQIF